MYQHERAGRREIGLHCSSLLVNPRRRHLPSSTALACFLLHSANKKAMLHITKSGPFFSRAAQIDLMKKNILNIYPGCVGMCTLEQRALLLSVDLQQPPASPLPPHPLTPSSPPSISLRNTHQIHFVFYCARTKFTTYLISNARIPPTSSLPFRPSFPPSPFPIEMCFCAGCFNCHQERERQCSSLLHGVHFRTG